MFKSKRISVLMIIIWFVLFGVAKGFQPDVDELMRTKGQPKIPDNYSSVMASAYQKEFSNYDKNTNILETLVIFSSEKRLTDSETKAISKWTTDLNKKKLKDSPILSITDPFSSKELQDMLVSKDEKTVIVPLMIDDKNTVKEVRASLKEDLKSVKIDSYITGSKYITEDQLSMTKEGMKKTEIVTVAFILLVLFSVFRSFVTPFITLLCIGISYAFSYNVATILVEQFNFPFSTTTQSFLLLILFGVGTDYSILLLSRYKEELGHGHSIQEALKVMMKTAGKTVFISAIAVFIGFSLLVFSEFSIFRSATAVAIGIFVLVCILFTLLPALMLLTGNKLFFPSKKIDGHKDNKWWGFLSTKATTYPIRTLIIIGVILVPSFLLHKGDLSYDMLKEISDNYESVQAMNIIEKEYSSGKAFPVTVWVEGKKDWETNEGMNTIGGLSHTLEQLPQTELVTSVVQPTGKPLKEFTTPNQSQSLVEGTNGLDKGLSSLNDGLTEMKDKFTNQNANGISLNPLIKGNEEVFSGIKSVEDAMHQLQNGSIQTTDGLKKLQAAVNKLLESMAVLNENTKALPAKVNQLSQGTTSLLQSYKTIADSTSMMSKGLEGLNQQLQLFIVKNPSFQQDPILLEMKKTIDGLIGAQQNITSGLNEVNGAFSQLNGQFQRLEEGIVQLSNGQAQLYKGWQEVNDGISKLIQGSGSVSDGQDQLINEIPTLLTGVQKLGDGQKELEKQLNKTAGQFNEVGDALQTSVDGIKKMEDGVGGLQDYLTDVSKNQTTTTYFLPETAFKDDNVKDVFDKYIGKDKKLTKLNVELKVDPYSEQGMDAVKEIEKITKGYVPNAIVAIGGVSSMNHDLNTIVQDDFNRTAIIMIVGFTIVLLFIIRSLPLVLGSMVSLVVAYFTAISITEWLMITLGYVEALSWAVPFFSFIIVMSIGIDYIIFLSLRYKENKILPDSEAIVVATKKMGGVITAAAIILIGTFASIYPSGIVLLMQISSVTILSILILNVCMLPLVLPAVVALGEKKDKHEHTTTT